MAGTSTKRRWLVPEVVQTSAMDCGPASLKCLLEGFGISASYGRLREACQTDVDGTSIDVLEQVAIQLGMDAEQIMIPVDHLLPPEAQSLPAMVVMRLPDGYTHFVVVWRRHGEWLQVMDPAVGRRWVKCQRFLQDLYRHRMVVPAAGWREWAGSEEFLAPLRGRLRVLGASATAAKTLISTSLGDPEWFSLAVLDAAIRMVENLVNAGGLTPGLRSMRFLQTLIDQTKMEPPATGKTIPALYWSVTPKVVADADVGGEPMLNLHGAVLLRIRGVQKQYAQDLDKTIEGARQISPELAAALTESAVRPLRELFRWLRADGILTPLTMAGIIAVAVGAVLIETLLFRGLFDIAGQLNLASQRLAGVIALLLFMGLLLALELPIAATSLRMGRHLEARLRVALLEKLPRLPYRYFQSRPISDMADRGHSIALTRLVPDLGIRFTQSFWSLLLTLTGIAFIDPASVSLAVVISVIAIIIPFATQPLLSERDLRLRAQGAALHSCYLDALLGLVAIRTHNAERAIRREHEGLLVEWVRSSRGLVKMSLTIGTVQSLLCMGFASVLLWQYFYRAGITGSVLLLVFWVLKLPAIGEQLAMLVRQYPAQRNVLMRLLEPLTAPEELTREADPEVSVQLAERSRSQRHRKQTAVTSDQTTDAVGIEFRGVSVVASGHTLLNDINLKIAPGEHIAVVGLSGAGKSTLLGLLMGWHRAAQGQILIDGAPLTEAYLNHLRRDIAWVDPGVQLWNRSFLDNLTYSAAAFNPARIGQVIKGANLLGVLQKLPNGLQTPLGEGGALVSGGEGQRVRLGRALLQTGVKLALLDEPFRGLDHEQRREHLKQVLRWWPEATIICVTHDVRETLPFSRVLVVENGHILEDGAPQDLANRASRYRQLLNAEYAVRKGIWQAGIWRRVRLEQGQLEVVAEPQQETKQMAKHA